MFDYIEPDVENRLQIQKLKAQNVLTRQGKTEQDLINWLIFALSKHYNIPTFDPCWSELTIDQLYYEYELVNGQVISPQQFTSNLLNENPKEAAALFDDWGPKKEIPKPRPADIDAIAKSFMETGKFKGETK